MQERCESLSRKHSGGQKHSRQRTQGGDGHNVAGRPDRGRGRNLEPKNMEDVSRAGVTDIINMQIEFPDDALLAKPYGIEVCWNPVDDDFEPKPPEVFEAGVKFAEEALEKPEAKLFIHCAAGVHRAPMMALAVLAVKGLEDGKTVEQAMEDAMDLIEEKRAAADFAEVYVKSVRRF